MPNPSFWKFARLKLPWDKVKSDLQEWKTDQSRTLSVVHESCPSFFNPELYLSQNLYAEFGYNEQNSKIWKTTSAKKKITFEWEQEICEQLPLDRAIATVTRQDPGQTLPWHQDKFFYLRSLWPDDARPIWRFLVHLEDWKIGHLLQIENEIHTHWLQGDCVVWHPEAMHLAANVGLEPKWTCNVTGFLTDSGMDWQKEVDQ